MQGWPEFTHPATPFCRMKRAGLFSASMRAPRLTLLPLALAVSGIGASALAATVYKWVDENGVVHYSDQPNSRAQAVEVQGAQPYGGDSQRAPVTSVSSQTPSAEPPAYSECVLYQPENDETFPNTSVVSGSIRMSPALQAGHRVTIVLDNRKVPNAVATATGFTLTEVERGTHTISFVIEDGQGKTLCQSGSVTIHVRQPSLLSPLRRGR